MAGDALQAFLQAFLNIKKTITGALTDDVKSTIAHCY